ncbi:hypothetical protein ERO13_A13G001350v2 [Gossypium hirsutum]|nr:hypothetical protein ERO13_A13G001350v2 [Gossypium hirsutum]
MRWSTEVKVGKEAFYRRVFWVKDNGVTQGRLALKPLKKGFLSLMRLI